MQMLSPKWNMYTTTPPSQDSRVTVERMSERMEGLEMVEENKKMVFPEQSRTTTHVNSEWSQQHRDTYTSPTQTRLKHGKEFWTQIPFNSNSIGNC